MNRIVLIFLWFLFSISTILAQNPSELSRTELERLYMAEYIGSAIEPIEWNGKLAKCQCGVLDDSIYKMAEKRVNFFRKVNNLPDINLDPNLNLDAQNAALLIKANNKLTHTPTKSMKCYSTSAYNGCNKSNIGFSNWVDFPQTSFITAFIGDYGASNYSVGHRKWILYTKLTSIGYGATDNTETLLVTEGVDWGTTSDLDFIAYPWSGFVPVDLIFPKWSFSIPENYKVDFSSAKVVMKDEAGSIIKSKKLRERKDFLDHTIVWTAEGLFTENDMLYGRNLLEENGYTEQKISVEITNVLVDGIKKDYRYHVTPIRIK